MLKVNEEALRLLGVRVEKARQQGLLMALALAALGGVVAGLGLLARQPFFMYGGAVFLAVAPVLYFYPAFEVSSRVKRVESELFPAALYMSLYATAGRDMVEGLYALARERQVAPNFASLIENMERFRVQKLAGTPHEAIAEAARSLEGSKVSAVMLSAATARSVGVSQELQARDILKSVLFELKTAYEKLSENMKLISEVMLIFYGVLPLMVLLMVSMFYTETSRLLLYSYTFLLIPLMGLVLIYLIHSMYPKTPESFLKRYRLYLYAVPIGVAVGVASYFLLSNTLVGVVKGVDDDFVRRGLANAYALAGALALGSAAAFAYVAVYYLKDLRWRMGILSGIPYYARDLAEMVKLGYSPALAMPRLSEKKSYGRHFDKFLKSLGKRLIGSTYSEAARQAGTGLPWIASVIVTATAEADRLGSKAEVFAEVADAARDVVDIIKAARSGIRGAVIFGLITVVIISVLLGFTVKQLLLQIASNAENMRNVASALPGSISLITMDKVPEVMRIALLGVVLNAVVLGIIIGKISDDNFLASAFYGMVAALIAGVMVLASVAL